MKVSSAASLTMDADREGSAVGKNEDGAQRSVSRSTSVPNNRDVLNKSSNRNTEYVERDGVSFTVAQETKRGGKEKEKERRGDSKEKEKLGKRISSKLSVSLAARRSSRKSSQVENNNLAAPDGDSRRERESGYLHRSDAWGLRVSLDGGAGSGGRESEMDQSTRSCVDRNRYVRPSS